MPKSNDKVRNTLTSIGVIIRIDTNSTFGFQLQISKLELSSLFLYLVGITRIRADIIDIAIHSDKDT